MCFEVARFGTGRASGTYEVGSRVLNVNRSGIVLVSLAGLFESLARLERQPLWQVQHAISNSPERQPLGQVPSHGAGARHAFRYVLSRQDPS